MGRHEFGHWYWDDVQDPEMWLAGITESTEAKDEPEEVKSLIGILLDRRVLPRLKKIRTSLRRTKDGPSASDQATSPVE